MLKTIKKSFKYLMILIGILLLVPTFFSLLLRIPEVQTFMVKRITGHISDQIKSTVAIGRFEYKFFNKIELKDLLVKDHNQDTMIYAADMTAWITGINLKRNIFRFGHIGLTKPEFALVTDTTGVMNLERYLQMISGTEKSPGKAKTTISFKQVTLKDGSFSLIDRNSKQIENRIDFSHLKLKGINGNVEDFRILDDSVTFSVTDLGFTESKGFLVRSMNSKVILAGEDKIFRDVFLYLDSSIINADRVVLDADTIGSFRNFKDDVRLDIVLRKSSLSGADLRYFVPSLDLFSGWVELSGRVSGTLSELKGRNIKIAYGDYSTVNCSFDLSGLPRIEDTFIHIGVNSFTTNAKDFEKLKTIKGKLSGFPPILYKLGNVSFNGSFTGFTTDFVTYGRLGTETGNLSTDISFRPEGNNKFRIKGLVKGTSIDLGKITDNHELLGKLSMVTNVDGFATSGNKISGSISGKIDSVDVNHYVYRNVELNGLFTEKTWDGSIKISDDNIKLDLLGMFDFSNDLPEFDFTLNLGKSDLYKLNFDKKDSTSRLSALLTANFRGNNFDNLFGEIKMLNSTLTKYGNKLDLYDFSLKAFNENGNPAISVRTDFMDADLRGSYKFSELGTFVRKAMSAIMPSKFKPPAQNKKGPKNEFAFALNFKNTDKINRFFRTKLLLSEKSSVEGSVYQDSLLRIKAKAKTLNYRNNILNDLAIDAEYSGDKFRADLNSSDFSLLGQQELENFRIEFNTIPDIFQFRLGWDNKDKISGKGEFIARGAFLKKENGQGSTFLKIDIDSSEIYNKNNLWKVKKSVITIDSNVTRIDRFIVASRYNSYAVDGTVSGNSADTLKLLFRGIELSPLGQLGEKNPKDQSTGMLLNPGGTVNGNVLISSALSNPLIESNIKINNFSLLGEEFGDMSLLSAWNSGSKVADINLYNNLDGKRNIEIKGFYDPEKKLLLLNGVASKLPVSGLNPLLGFFASEITGTASGKITLTRRPGELVLNGALMAENTSMKINYLQTKFKLNDTIRFDKTGIKFRNSKVTDEKGNSATISGSIFHKNFRDYSVDLTINMDKNDCFVLNTTQKDNGMFYGTVYASGVTTIRSGTNSLAFDISARTGKGTRFFIPLNSGMSVSDYSFVTFVSHDTASLKESDKNARLPARSEGSSLELNFDLDVTPEAEVQLLIDPKAGDVIRGRGEGKLNLSLNKQGEFKIFGDYVIDEGDYLFTLQNLFNKRFDVESGGTVSFNGNVENAGIDLTARYKNLRTSLYPILYPILQDEKYKTRIPVEPQLILSGKLFNPVVGFNIYLPNADEETRTYLRNAITTQEELSKQFLYLLVMNSFYSDPSQSSYSSSMASSVGGTSAMAVTTTEMLSNQLSNWLSQISNDFDVGFNYRPGNKDINTQELQVALSTQLLNDRVTINGSFDVRGQNNTDGTPLSGDFDIEYKITEKIRFKAFNRYNNPYTGRGAPYTQGLGIFFKQDFNRLSDIFRRKQNSDMKKEDEIKAVE
jgi:hypothetical protein